MTTPFLCLSEIAERIGCNRRTVLRWAERGFLTVKWGHLRRGAPGYIVPTKDAQDFIRWYGTRPRVLRPKDRRGTRGRLAS